MNSSMMGGEPLRTVIDRANLIEVLQEVQDAFNSGLIIGDPAIIRNTEGMANFLAILGRLNFTLYAAKYPEKVP